MFQRSVTLVIFALLVYWGAMSFAHAHDYWADGKKVPDWVKASCCGPADAHHLSPAQVHGPMSREEAYAFMNGADLPVSTKESSDESRYYVVDGYQRVIPSGLALPSQDGDYWIFYRDDGPINGQSGVYCFFVPMAF